jgi:hypothetical protein
MSQELGNPGSRRVHWSAELLDALGQIVRLGGNLTDDCLTDTGPGAGRELRDRAIDAACRGLMYCEARKIAREAIAKVEAV